MTLSETGSHKLKIFITGAAGFITSHLIPKLEALGHEVWGCDISFSDNPRIRRIDVADFGGLERMIQFVNPHVVLHAANFGNRYPGNFSYDMLWRTNLVGTEHILELQKRYGFELVYTSSSEVYGTKSHVLLYENYEGDWWYNDYAASKWVSEKLIKRQIDENPYLHAVILRLFGVYGEGQPHTKDNSVIAQFIDKLQNDEPIEIHDCSRCFLYVADCVEALISAIHKAASLEGCPVFNIGSKESVTIGQLVDLITDILQKPPVKLTTTKKVLVGVKDKMPDTFKAHDILKWSPQIPLRQGLTNTIFAANPSRAKDKKFGLYVGLFGEEVKSRRLSCAERCTDEETILMEDK